MTRIALVVCFALALTQSHAQENSTARILPDVIYSSPVGSMEIVPFVAYDDKPFRSQEIVRLGVGGCIRGPFTVSNSRGEMIFRLDAGADFPDGCSK